MPTTVEEHEPLPLKLQSKKRNILHWHYLGRGWLIMLWDYLHMTKGSIQIPSMWKPQLTREHDVTIMDTFIADHSPTQSQLAKVNLVRLWLRFLTLSAITDIEGLHIESWVRSGVNRRESSLHWP